MTSVIAEPRSLLAELAGGDSSAFWPLWQQHSQRLFAVCLHEMRGHRADAEDALGQAMLKAFEELPRVAGEMRCVEAWLICLTRNLCRDLLRRRGRDEQPAEAIECLPDVGQEDGIPDDVDVEALIRALPPWLQEVVMLRVLRRMPYKEISEQLHVTADAARKRMQRAKEMLQQRNEVACSVPRVAHRRAETMPFECSRNRAHQKIATLRAYVKEHPGGWKKHLRLADLLYIVGSLPEAADCYQHVLRKRPWLTEVSARLNAVLQMLTER